MSQTVWTDLIADVHSSGRQIVLAVTGGGSKAISQLLDVAGASRSVLEATVPYSSASMESWLGGEPEQYCSESTARMMAMRAWMRARELAADIPADALVGVGATASLATDRPKKGEHRIHVAMQTAEQTVSLSLTLVKDYRDRKKEQWLAAKLILLAVGEICGVDTIAAAAALHGQFVDGEQIDRTQKKAEADWTALLTGEKKCIELPRPSEGSLSAMAKPQVVFPGSFNPLHVGHQRMSQLAMQRLGDPVAYELSITNVDKPTLDFVEIDHRLITFRQQDANAFVVLTDAPTFLEKSALFPDCTFVVGADTIMRIAEARYYEGGQHRCEAAIQLLAERGCRFLVFGRLVDGQYQGLSDLRLPNLLRELCEEVTETKFRQDISSTEIRAETEEG